MDPPLARVRVQARDYKKVTIPPRLGMETSAIECRLVEHCSSIYQPK